MTLEERIESLERQLACARQSNRSRSLVGAGLVAGILVAAWAIAGAEGKAQSQPASGTERTIRATAFILEDESGGVRARLCVEKNGPRLQLMDESGKPRVGLVTTKEGAGFAMLDEKGNPRLGLSTTKDFSALHLMDDHGMVRARLTTDKLGPNLYLADEKGNSRVILGFAEEGPMICLLQKNGILPLVALSGFDGGALSGFDGGRVALSDGTGTPRASLSANSMGAGLTLSDEKGQSRVTLDVNKSELMKTSLNLWDEKGIPRVMLSLYEGGPRFDMRDRQEKIIWSAPTARK